MILDGIRKNHFLVRINRSVSSTDCLHICPKKDFFAPSTKEFLFSGAIIRGARLE